MRLKFDDIVAGIGMRRRHVNAQHLVDGIAGLRIDNLAVFQPPGIKILHRFIPEIAKNGPGNLDRCRTAKAHNSDACFADRRGDRRDGFHFHPRIPPTK